MDRIEELLVEMCRAQGQATEYRVQGKNEEMRGAVGRRDHLWRRTAADWRAMVEALGAAQYALEEIGGLATVNEGDVITMLPYQAKKLARLLNETRPTVEAVLARVKGE